MEVFIKKPDNYDKNKWPAGSAASEGSATGEFVFNNGTHIFGEISVKGLEGQCKIDFAEGSQLNGQFKEGKIVSAHIRYAPGVQVIADYAQLSQTNESYMKRFVIKLRSGWRVKGTSNDDGEIESAQILMPNNQIAAECQGQEYKFKIPDAPSKYIIISSIWIYEGGVDEKSHNGSKQPIFESPGIQIWIRGIGYHSFQQVGEYLRKTIFRYSRNLELYRDAIYSNNFLVKSISIYGNGLIFSTKNEYFTGQLIFVLPDNSTRSFECQMDEYWFLKAGTLVLNSNDPQPKNITFKRKNRRLVFCFENSELDFYEFIKILQVKSKF